MLESAASSDEFDSRLGILLLLPFVRFCGARQLRGAGAFGFVIGRCSSLANSSLVRPAAGLVSPADRPETGVMFN